MYQLQLLCGIYIYEYSSIGVPLSPCIIGKYDKADNDVIQDMPYCIRDIHVKFRWFTKQSQVGSMRFSNWGLSIIKQLREMTHKEVRQKLMSINTVNLFAKPSFHRYCLPSIPTNTLYLMEVNLGHVTRYQKNHTDGKGPRRCQISLRNRGCAFPDLCNALLRCSR